MHHKRKKTKRNVRCTLCTPYRWMGNTKERHRHSTVKNKAIADGKLQEEKAPDPRKD